MKNFSQATSGFTLIELMVYIALLGGIVLIAGQAFSDSTKMRVRTQSMLQANQNAGNVSSILKEDITQLGAKSSQEAAAAGASMDNFSTDHIHDVFIDPDNADNAQKDSSSYRIGNNGNLDTLIYKRIRYDQDGHYVAVDSIFWYVDGGILKRGCKTVSGAEDIDQCPSSSASVVEMAEGVQRFNITAAEPGATESTSHILPSTDTSVHKFRLVPRYGDDNLAFTKVEPPNGDLSVVLSGFASNYNFDNQEPVLDGRNSNQVFLAQATDLSGNWQERCAKITLETNTEYEISFSMPYSSDASRLFCPGRDYMGVGFRYTNDGARPNEINDFMFYPPTHAGASEGARKFRFRTMHKIENVCMSFTFASYSPVVGSGKITLSEVVLKKVESANYTFSGAEIAPTEKKNVKALRLELTMGVRGESSVLSLIIPIPSNGTKD